MPEEFRELLTSKGQEHVLRFWDEISETARQRLIDQISQIDFDQLSQLVSGNDHATDWGELAARAELPPAISLQEFENGVDRKLPIQQAAAP